ncbi:MAG: phosphoenolpyruvate carboxykinase (GTP) [Chlamydiia bacterium]
MHLAKWLQEVVQLCRPERVHICDGSEAEAALLQEELISRGQLVRLNPALRPNSFWCRTHPDDTARVEERTFICTTRPEQVGPTNHWADPSAMEAQLKKLFAGSMSGRVAYVIPFLMGPMGAKHSMVGVQITDSPYVVLNMRIMTLMGPEVLALIHAGTPFIPCLHSVGMPLELGQKDSYWPCNPQNTVIAHFPETRRVYSYGSGYGGNALLSKKSLALRLASWIGHEEGWLAEHMLIMGLKSPEGEKRYLTAAFPSSCGKTVLSMIPTESVQHLSDTPGCQPAPGWTTSVVGDDIAWLWWTPEGLRALNPETGMFGVAPGTNEETAPHIIQTIRANTIFTNTALTCEGDVWWEGLTPTPPEGVISWLGRPWSSDSGEKAAHPNSRFTAPLSQSPVLDPHWRDPDGVPISAVIFGGRRTTLMPLVVEGSDWTQGVFYGASLGSETTAAAAGTVGMLRHDPFAMLPFCGYNMADYIHYWESFKQQPIRPKIFAVNWFRKGPDGKFIWPGYQKNLKVLQWIHARCGKTPPPVNHSVLGELPDPSAGFPEELVTFETADMQEELDNDHAYLESLGAQLGK